MKAQWEWVNVGTGDAHAIYYDATGGVNGSKCLRSEFSFGSGDTDAWSYAGMDNSTTDWSGYTGIKAWIKASTTGDSPQYIRFLFHETNGDKMKTATIDVANIDANGQYVYLDFIDLIDYGSAGTGAYNNDILDRLSDIKNIFISPKYVGSPTKNSTMTLYLDDISIVSLNGGAAKTLDYDGIDDHIDVGNDASIKRYASDFTIEAWINLDMYSTTNAYVECILSNRDATGNGSLFYLSGTDNGSNSKKMTFYIGTGSTFRGTSQLNEDTWYHVALTFLYNGSNDNVGEIYVNGILENTSSTLDNISNPGTNNTYIGEDLKGASPSEYHWNGMIDEVRIWSDVRTETEIRDNMCKTLTGSEAGLVGYWRFDESDGTSNTDSSPNSNTGTMTNMSLTTAANDRMWSGASIGDNSGYDYNGSVVGDFSVNLTHSDGDDITATGDGGTITGIQVYRVDEMPNIVEAPSTYNKISSMRYWGVFPIGSTPTYTVTYNYNGHPGISDESTLKLAYRADNSTTSWTDLAATLDQGANTLSKTGQSGTEYVIGSTSSTDNSLPVTLTLFSASVERSGTVTLEWVTESEIENLGFILERRSNGDIEEWKEIASYIKHPELQGQGSVTYRTEYSYTDNTVEEGKIYDFQLADVSFDGVKEYHALSVLGFTVTKPIPEEYSVSPAYPNPFNPVTRISFNLPDVQHVTVSIYDLTGREIVTLTNREYSAGSHSVAWNATDFGSGVYFYHLNAGTFTAKGKLMLVK